MLTRLRLLFVFISDSKLKEFGGQHFQHGRGQDGFTLEVLTGGAGFNWTILWRGNLNILGVQ